jgi:hypothetical protein
VGIASTFQEIVVGDINHGSSPADGTHAAFINGGVMWYKGSPAVLHKYKRYYHESEEEITQQEELPSSIKIGVPIKI